MCKSANLNQIIIVSDEKINHFIEEEVIEKLTRENRLTVFTSVDYALRYLTKACIIREESICPDLILLEKNMKKVDGFNEIDFIEQLTSQGTNVFSAIRIVLISSNFTTEEKTAFSGLGVFDYLEKPVTKEKINDILLKYFSNLSK